MTFNDYVDKHREIMPFLDYTNDMKSEAFKRLVWMYNHEVIKGTQGFDEIVVFDQGSRQFITKKVEKKKVEKSVKKQEK